MTGLNSEDELAATRSDLDDHVFAAVRHSVRSEIRALDAERGVAETAGAAQAVRKLVAAMLPEICARVSAPLLSLEAGDRPAALSELFGQPPFTDPRLDESRRAIKQHAMEWVTSMSRWDGWTPLGLVETESQGVVEPLRRESDGWIAADFVGLVSDSEDWPESDDPMCRVFASGAQAALQAMCDEFTDVRGLRMWILGEDGAPVVRWVYAHDLDI